MEEYKMNKINILLMTLSVSLFMSCLSDDGNYDYKQLGNVDISGLEDSYRFILQEKVNLKPSVKTDINQDHLNYCWRIGADTLSKSKDLDYTFVRIPTSSDPLTFEVYDKTTDVRYSKKIKMSVVSPFYTGWLILADENGKSVLDFQSYEAGQHFYHDLYKEVNGEDMKGEPVAVKQLNYQDGFTGAYADRVVVVNKDGESPDLDGTSLLKYTTFESQFKKDEKPSVRNITAEYYGSDKVVCVVTASGKVYGKTPGGMGTPEDGYFQYPYREDSKGYTLAPFLVRGGYTQYYFGFDTANHRFVYFTSSYLSSTISPLIWDRTESVQNVDLERVEGTPVWMGSFLYNENVYTIMKRNGGYWLYCFKVKYDATSTLTACAKLSDGLIGSNSLFQVHPTSPYLFVTNGNKLMALNLENLGNMESAVNEIATYDGEITAMHYAYDNNKSVNELAIAVKQSSGTSSVLLIDPQLTAHGQVLKHYDNIQGRVVSLYRKVM